jgi:adenylate cyclase
MALEIERRFLVIDETWRQHVEWEAEIKQGYLFSSEDGLTTRIRVQTQPNRAPQAWLTIKAKGPSKVMAHARLEFEYAIPVEDAEELLSLSPWYLEKKRHGLHLSEGDWVLDIFSGSNSPLVIAEVELTHPEAKPPIPVWCGKEVTGVHQLSNAALARHPLQNWQKSEIRTLLD